MRMPKDIVNVIFLATLLDFVSTLVGYFFAINMYLAYDNLIISALVLTLLNAPNVLSLPQPYIFKRIRSVKGTVITFSILALLVVLTLGLGLAPAEVVLLVLLFDFLVVGALRALGYYVRASLSKYGEFIDYNSLRQALSFVVSIISLVLVGPLSEFTRKAYLPVVTVPLLAVALLSATLKDVEIALSSANSFKVWTDYMRNNRVFRFLEVRIYPVMALGNGLTVLFFKLVYVNSETFPEYISIVFIVAMVAQAVGAAVALKWKTRTARNLLLLSLPAISVEFVFPFVRGELLPISALTLLESALVAYVFVHIRSIYQYVVSKDAYVNVAIAQGIIMQASMLMAGLAVSAIATLVGITYTYIGTASALLLAVLSTIFSGTIKEIKLEK